MTSLMAEDSDATAILAALAGPGRPTADEKRGKSVQERFRVPASWSSYIEHAAIRDGFNNEEQVSEGPHHPGCSRRVTKSTACRPRNTEGERFVTIPSRGPFPFFHSRRSSLGSANEHARHAGASIDFDNLRQGPFDSVHFQREIRLSHTRPFRHQTAMWSFRRKHDTKSPVEYEAPTHKPIRTVSIREVHRHGPCQSRDPLSRPKGATKGRPQRETLRPAVRTGQWICRFVYGRPTFHDPTGNMSLPGRTDRSMLIWAPVSKQGYISINTNIPSQDPTGCKRSTSARTRA